MKQSEEAKSTRRAPAGLQPRVSAGSRRARRDGGARRGEVTGDSLFVELDIAEIERIQLGVLTDAPHIGASGTIPVE